jgi:hypothetical protein
MACTQNGGANGAKQRTRKSGEIVHHSHAIIGIVFHEHKPEATALVELDLNARSLTSLWPSWKSTASEWQTSRGGARGGWSEPKASSGRARTGGRT